MENIFVENNTVNLGPFVGMSRRYCKNKFGKFPDAKDGIDNMGVGI